MTIAVYLRLVLEAIDQRVVDSGFERGSRLSGRRIVTILSDTHMRQKQIFKGLRIRGLRKSIDIRRLDV